MTSLRTGSSHSGTAHGAGETATHEALPAVVILSAAVVFMAGVAAANPSPGASWEDGGFSILQTTELVVQKQTATSDDSATVLILYGGPSLVYTHFPEDHTGLGVGAEAGIELRRQFCRRASGPFASLYAGAGALWPAPGSDASLISAASLGVKLGWRIPVGRGDPAVDVEPYTAVAFGVSLASDLAFSGAIYLGLKFALF